MGALPAGGDLCALSRGKGSVTAIAAFSTRAPDRCPPSDANLITGWGDRKRNGDRLSRGRTSHAAAPTYALYDDAKGVDRQEVVIQAGPVALAIHQLAHLASLDDPACQL